MNKFVKGAIATGAATALLIGGGATLALWNDQTTVGASEKIESGLLTIEASTGTWSTNPAKWVPGDSFEYTTQVTIVAQGDNMLAELKIDPATISGTEALRNALKYELTVANVQNGTLTQKTPDVLTVAAANKTSGTPITADVKVKVEFPETPTSDLVAQGATVQLGNLQLLLSQVTE